MPTAAQINAQIQATRDKAISGQGIVLVPGAVNGVGQPRSAGGNSNVPSGAALNSAQVVVR